MNHQRELIEINSEFAAVVAEARDAVTAGDAPPNTGGRGAVLFHPVTLYGEAAVRLAGSEGKENDTATVADFERLIRFTALKIRSGDRDYVIESLLGQQVWLKALSLRLALHMEGVASPQGKATLGALLMRIQAAATKNLATLAAVSSIE